MTDNTRLEGYRECHLCTIREKMGARRCSHCTGRLDLKDRLLLEAEKRWRDRIAPALSAVVPGLGQWFSGRTLIGTCFFALAPLGIGIILTAHRRWDWGLTVLTLSCFVVWVLAVLDAKKGSRDFRPPCQMACPVGIFCSRYVHMVANGLNREALELVESLCPFPGTIGRICPHPCEQECNRGKDGEPVAVCTLKRFVEDYADRPYDLYGWELEKNGRPSGQKVAVVGAGPSGLTAALYLRLFGLTVSLFESEDFGGGTPAIYMPDFRLPAATYLKEVNRILDLGFDLHFGKKLGRDFTLRDIQDQDYSAVYLAMGAMRSFKLAHTGEEHEGFLDGKEFLARIRSGKGVRLGGDVLVIGGGNVAVDVARSAVRSGADSVRIVSLERKPEPAEKRFRYQGNGWREIKPPESIRYMPAFAWEVEDALKEGVEIVDGFAAETFEMENGRVAAANCLQVERIERNRDGGITPVLREGTSRRLKADWVLLAVGSSPDRAFLGEVKKSVPISDRASLVRLENATDWNIPVVAGGDFVSGPASVIEAIAAGKEAALYLYRKVMGGAPVSVRCRPRNSLEPWANYSDSLDMRTRRREMALAEEERRTSFSEVYGGYTVKTAREEAERCMRCDWPLTGENKVRKFFRTLEK